MVRNAQEAGLCKPGPTAKKVENLGGGIVTNSGSGLPDMLK